MKTNTFQARLDKITDKLIDDSVEAKAKWHNGGTFTNYHKRLNKADAEAKAAIIDLVLNDVIGENRMSHSVPLGWPQRMIDEAITENRLKDKQRAIIKGGNHED